MTPLNNMKHWFALLACASAAPLVAQDADAPLSAQELAVKTERDYADALLANGYSDFARLVSDAAKKKFPKSKVVFEAVDIRIDLAQGNFDRVKKTIAARPDKDSVDTWSLKLEMANYYYMYQKFKESDDIYKGFFAAIKTPNNNTREVFIKAAYNYIQLLQKSGRNKEALDYYRILLRTKMGKREMRNVQSETLAQLIVIAEKETNAGEKTKLVNEAEKLARKMIYIPDNFFGDAIMGLANVYRLRGEINKAQEIISEYTVDLMRIHDNYKEADPDGSKGVLRMSPMPACRYFLGKILLDEAKKEIAKGPSADDNKIKALFLGERNPKTRKRNGQGAYNHLINVFVTYPESIYALQAGELSEEVQAIIAARYKVSIGAKIPEEQKTRVRQQQYIGANVLFSENKWDDAAQAFSELISKFGMTQEAIEAMKNMVFCYLYAGGKAGKMDPTYQLYADTVTRHLAEGCSGVEDFVNPAGNALIEIANKYGDSKVMRRKNEVLELFSQYYPTHPRAPQIAQERAADLIKTGEIDRGIRQYQRIVEHYNQPAQKQVKIVALYALYDIYSPKGQRPDATKEMAVIQETIKTLGDSKRPGQMMAVAQYRLGDAYRHLAEAANAQTLEKQDGETAEAFAARQQADIDAQKRAYYAKAAGTYRALANILTTPNNKYQSVLSEKATNDKILEGAMFQAGLCMQRIPALSDKQKAALQTASLAGYNTYIETYPKGLYAARALLQIGTIYTSQAKMDQAQQCLDRLAKEFADSPEAKNAIPLLAESLFKMGMRGEAISKYKQMISTNGKFTPGQYIEAAKQLLAAKEYAVAIEAADKAIASTKNNAQIAQALLVKTQALLNDKKPNEAYALIKNELLKKFGNTTVALDANLLLVDVIAAKIVIEKSADARNEMIGEVKRAVNFIKAQRKDAMSADLDLAVARVAEKRYHAERELGASPDAINNARGVTVIAYDSLIFANTEPENPIAPLTDAQIKAYALAKPFVQDAYLGLINILLESEDQTSLTSAIENAERYLKAFPDGKHVVAINNALNNAKIKLGN